MDGMTAYFNTYPVTPDMGLRESIDAMLAHTCHGSSMGYRADCVSASNYRSILLDYGTAGGLVQETHKGMTDYLVLSPHISDSEGLADFVRILVYLCNDYPLYNDEDYGRLEDERTLETLEDMRSDNDPSAAALMRALWDLGLDVSQDGGDAYVSDEFFSAALDYLKGDRA